MINLENKKILVTGGNGFLGQHLVRKLHSIGVTDLVAPRSAECDLKDVNNCRNIVKDIDIVIHAAGDVGGIGYNKANPGRLFYDNLIMGVQLMEQARLSQVEKFVAIGTICAYPKNTPIPFNEEYLWNGYPEETNAPYGLAKKMMLVQAQAYREQYGFNAIYLLPVNLYGPGDHFEDEKSHVIPALIKKVVEAKEKKLSSIEVWGTGTATREFLYVDDAAEAIVKAAKLYDKTNPVNIGSGFEISIKELVEKVCRICRYKGEIKWDTTKPDGQPKRRLNTTLALTEFGFKAKTNFDEGLENTVDWYLQNKVS